MKPSLSYFASPRALTLLHGAGTLSFLSMFFLTIVSFGDVIFEYPQSFILTFFWFTTAVAALAGFLASIQAVLHKKTLQFFVCAWNIAILPHLVGFALQFMFYLFCENEEFDIAIFPETDSSFILLVVVSLISSIIIIYELFIFYRLLGGMFLEQALIISSLLQPLIFPFIEISPRLAKHQLDNGGGFLSPMLSFNNTPLENIFISASELFIALFFVLAPWGRIVWRRAESILVRRGLFRSWEDIEALDSGVSANRKYKPGFSFGFGFGSGKKKKRGGNGINDGDVVEDSAEFLHFSEDADIAALEQSSSSSQSSSQSSQQQQQQQQSQSQTSQQNQQPQQNKRSDTPPILKFFNFRTRTSSYDDGLHETVFVPVGSDASPLVQASEKHAMRGVKQYRIVAIVVSSFLGALCLVSVLNSIRMQISNFDNEEGEFFNPRGMMQYSFFSHFVYALKTAFILFMVPFSAHLLHTSILPFSEALSKLEKSGNNFGFGQNKDEVGGEAVPLNFGGRQAPFAFGQLHPRIEASDVVGTSGHGGSQTSSVGASASTTVDQHIDDRSTGRPFQGTDQQLIQFPPSVQITDPVNPNLPQKSPAATSISSSESTSTKSPSDTPDSTTTS
ncbi:MAG: hypothetical protein EZS28_025462 [Streblomastix strix]|uniref:Uncharacterized protein n=1 Tax=Streblomastix strix TaxID=222440 RepID=A0A5J4V942_9EUKA|nr:MAG: hypothetical protein EZS28_025462 [Streblomastix strix]